MFTKSSLPVGVELNMAAGDWWMIALAILPLMGMEICNETCPRLAFSQWPQWARWGGYWYGLGCIMFLSAPGANTFIYFQF